jgi:hypothetical protein
VLALRCPPFTPGILSRYSWLKASASLVPGPCWASCGHATLVGWFSALGSARQSETVFSRRSHPCPSSAARVLDVMPCVWTVFVPPKLIRGLSGDRFPGGLGHGEGTSLRGHRILQWRHQSLSGYRHPGHNVPRRLQGVPKGIGTVPLLPCPAATIITRFVETSAATPCSVPRAIVAAPSSLPHRLRVASVACHSPATAA